MLRALRNVMDVQSVTPKVLDRLLPKVPLLCNHLLPTLGSFSLLIVLKRMAAGAARTSLSSRYRQS